jgi:hypothetical protein
MLSTKKTIKTIGKSVELSGHIILLAAAVVGLFAIPLALAAADSKNKKESQQNQGYQPTTVVNNNTTNNYFFGNFFDCGSRSTASRVSTQEFLNGLLIFSLVSSTIGIALSLYLGVPWVAGLVGGLWLAGVGLAKLGEQIVSYAKQMPAPVYVQSYPSPPPSAPYLEQQAPMPEINAVHVPSAPPLYEFEPGEGTPWLYEYMVY